MHKRINSIMLAAAATLLSPLAFAHAGGKANAGYVQGAAAYNQTLSEQRAASVKDYLVKNGIDGNVISTAGAGDSQPKASNATAAGRAQNRRVQLVIKTQRQVVP